MMFLINFLLSILITVISSFLLDRNRHFSIHFNGRVNGEITDVRGIASAMRHQCPAMPNAYIQYAQYVMPALPISMLYGIEWVSHLIVS